MPPKKVRKPRTKPTIKKTGQKQKQTVKVVVNLGGKEREKEPPRASGHQLTMYAPPISVFTRENPPMGFREPETTAPVYKMPSQAKATAMPFTTPVPANPNFSPEESSISREERIVDAVTDDPIDINAGLPADKYARINKDIKWAFDEYKKFAEDLPFKSPEPMMSMGSDFISQPADTGIFTTPARRPIPPEKLEAYQRILERKKRTPTSGSGKFNKPKSV